MIFGLRIVLINYFAETIVELLNALKVNASDSVVVGKKQIGRFHLN